MSVEHNIITYSEMRCHIIHLLVRDLWPPLPSPKIIHYSTAEYSGRGLGCHLWQTLWHTIGPNWLKFNFSQLVYVTSGRFSKV